MSIDLLVFSGEETHGEDAILFGETPVTEICTMAPWTGFRFSPTATESGLILTESAYQGDADLVAFRASDALRKDVPGLSEESVSPAWACERIQQPCR